MEYFKDVPGYEGFYQISNYGRVLSVRREKLMSLVSTADGYKKLIFRVNKKQKCFLVHRLVMLTFHGKCPQGLVVNHKNFKRDDNRLCNLEYISINENIKYSRSNGRHIKYKSYIDDRFTIEHILNIRKSSATDTELSYIYKCRRSFINKIRHGKSYSWVTT